MTLPARSGIMREQSMYYNIRNSLGITALALIIAAAAGQPAYAQLPNSGATNALPSEITLNDTDDDSGLLVPPSLNDDAPTELPAPQSDDEAIIPLTGPDQNASNDLNLPNLNGDSGLLPPDNNAPNNTAPIQPMTAANQAPSAGLPAAAPQVQPANPILSPLSRPQPTTPESSNFGEGILSQVDNELFNQMSDLEKQTSLLTLELRREKVKNEIAAIKAARQKAVDDLNEKKAEKERKRIEWEKEQERKLLVEEQKLRELNIAYEKLRQENIVNAYKEQMLDTNQKWIENNARLYGEIVKTEEDREKLVKNFKMKLNHLAQLASKAADAAETAKKNYSRELANLQTQISILKSRLEAEKLAREEENTAKNKDKTNPFASASEENAEEKKNQKLSDEYAIMEISGKGNELAAKLINKSGSSFMVQKGTVLQSGHTVDEISQTYLRADKNGTKDYLYFAAGGVLDREPVRSSAARAGITPLPQRGGNGDNDLEPLPSLNSSQGLPSLREGMFIR